MKKVTDINEGRDIQLFKSMKAVSTRMLAKDREGPMHPKLAEILQQYAKATSWTECKANWDKKDANTEI